MSHDLIRRVAQQVRDAVGCPLEQADGRGTHTTLPLAAPADPKALAGLIDHTLLKPDATPEQISRLCLEAAQYGFASVCVNPIYVPHCRTVLAGRNVPVCTVIGFPLGASATLTRVYEASLAVDEGARELDLVIAIGQLKAGEYVYVLNDLKQVVTVAHAGGAICKVIIETALLNDEEKIAACLLAGCAEADFVKTSTGFAGGGATAEDVALMRRVVGPYTGVKASGGVRTRADVLAMIAAGATRIGASAGVHIVREAEELISDEPGTPGSY